MNCVGLEYQPYHVPKAGLNPPVRLPMANGTSLAPSEHQLGGLFHLGGLAFFSRRAICNEVTSCLCCYVKSISLWGKLSAARTARCARILGFSLGKITVDLYDRRHRTPLRSGQQYMGPRNIFL